VVCGGAPGVDTFGARYAKLAKIPVRYFRANWQKHGQSAGPRRNGLMVKYAEALIAVWDGKSRGTKNVIETARRHGLLVHVHLIKEQGDLL
jgi:hypothetical protein